MSMRSAWAPLLVVPTLVASLAVPGGGPGRRVPPKLQGHTISGIKIAGAGVVPYVELPGRGIHFLLQGLTNGTRAGKLSDFGGRRESDDADAFFTAARELCEETGAHSCMVHRTPRMTPLACSPIRAFLLVSAGYAFGEVDALASSLRSSSTVRILNRQGRYVCFFLKVSEECYLPAGSCPEVDGTSEELASRDVRWWTADELLRSVPEERLLERMLTTKGGPAGLPSGQRLMQEDLSAFHRAVCKTLTLENAVAQVAPEKSAEERWDSSVLEAIATTSEREAVVEREAVDASRFRRYANSLAVASTSRRSSSKRGSRRGPAKVSAMTVPWQAEQRWHDAASRNAAAALPGKHKAAPTKAAAAKRKRRLQPERAEVALELEIPDIGDWSGFSP